MIGHFEIAHDNILGWVSQQVRSEREELLRFCSTGLERAIGELLVTAGDGETGLVRALEPDDPEPDGHGMWVIPQRKIGTYRADFVVYRRIARITAKLIVECDGSYWHTRSQHQRLRDRQRDAWLAAHGWEVMRFSDHRIRTEPHVCVEEVTSRLFDMWVLGVQKALASL